MNFSKNVYHFLLFPSCSGLKLIPKKILNEGAAVTIQRIVGLTSQHQKLFVYRRLMNLRGEKPREKAKGLFGSYF